MKNFTKSLFPVLVLFFLSSQSANATNVSGGIYNNTTWTLANSPYIVVDTVVVFPGVTLTIEPGVTVKFYDHTYLEIRQGTLIALGTSSDSITFTSNSLSPSRGIWSGIHLTNITSLQIDYCIFKYSNGALNGFIPLPILLRHLYFYENAYCLSNPGAKPVVTQSSFYKNGFGLGPQVEDCQIDSCLFLNNDYGVMEDGGVISNSTFLNNGTGAYLGSARSSAYLVKNCIFCNNNIGCSDLTNTIYHDTISNCNFSQNHIGLSGYLSYIKGNIFSNNDTAFDYIHPFANDSVLNNCIYHNNVGILLGGGTTAHMMNNNLCNNYRYNLQYTSSVNTVFPNTCWCDTDSATISAKIYNGYQNVSLGLIRFTPFINCDSSAITGISPINCQTLVFTQIKENVTHPIATFEIFPNPSSSHLTIKCSENILHRQIKIFNMLGELKYSEKMEKQSIDINISDLPAGIFIIEVDDGNGFSCQKFIKQQPY